MAEKTQIEQLKDVITMLRAENGCPWDREQTIESLKPCIVEEAAEVICGINLYTETGNPENLKEELGDLLLQVVMQAEIASELGLFNFEDVAQVVKEKMIRRHPHVFADAKADTSAEVLANWAVIKEGEKAKKQDATPEQLFAAFDESKALIDRARERKEKKLQKK